MFKKALGVSTGFLLHALHVHSQGFSHVDTIRSSNAFDLHEYHIQVPLGQTFIKNGGCQGFSTVRFHVPDAQNHAAVALDSSTGHFFAGISMGSKGTSTQCANRAMRGGASVMSVSRSSVTVDDDPAKYLMELKANPSIPSKMVMNLGYGSAWLDLSGMDIRELDIQSGNADVFLTYKTRNAAPMSGLDIRGAMSKVVIRNLELARAERVTVENGMGSTKIIIGKDAFNKTNMDLNVGAGTCTVLVNSDYPVKLILNSSMFSTVEIPKEYIETADNTFVNLAYKSNPQHAITVKVDVSIGSFYLISYE